MNGWCQGSMVDRRPLVHKNRPRRRPRPRNRNRISDFDLPAMPLNFSEAILAI